MSSVGAYLRDLREGKGVSLQDIARATRVGRRHLEALEGEELRELPAPVFVKGFIRAYCEFLGTRPDEALAHYRTLLGEPAISPGAAAARRARPSRQLTPIAVSLLLLAVLVGGLVALNLGLRGGAARSGPAIPAAQPQSAPVGESQPVKPTETAGAAPAPAAPAAAPRPEWAATPDVAAPAAEPVAPKAGQRLVVKAIERTWIRVQTDRGTVEEELLPAGAVREWSTETHFVLTVGNAGGLELTLNGQRLPPLGDRGAVIRELVLPHDFPAPRS